MPEGENGYDPKKIEESFRLPCDEIGNDDCIIRVLGIYLWLILNWELIFLLNFAELVGDKVIVAMKGTGVPDKIFKTKLGHSIA